MRFASSQHTSAYVSIRQHTTDAEALCYAGRDSLLYEVEQGDPTQDEMMCFYKVLSLLALLVQKYEH